MNFSNTYEIFELMIKAGIHHNPASLTQEELFQLSKNPEVKNKLLRLLNNNNPNFYQELEMGSSYVNTHRDISHVPENIQLHSHSFYELIYCERGTIQYLIEDKRYRIHAGDIILVPPGISHRPLFYQDMPEPYSRIVLWINSDFFHYMLSICSENLTAQLKAREHFLLRTEGTPYKYLERLFKRGVLEAEEKSPLWELSVCGNTAMLLSHLSRALLSSREMFPLEKEEHIDRIISFIEVHYAEKITLESTAKEFHISTSTLGKLFLHKLGISFYQFVTQRRLINSKLKIEKGNSMEEVALSCGFCDYSAFYRAFKKEYGISPREYKKRISPNIEF